MSTGWACGWASLASPLSGPGSRALGAAASSGLSSANRPCRLRQKWNRVDGSLEAGFSLEPEVVAPDVLLAVGEQSVAPSAVDLPSLAAAAGASEAAASPAGVAPAASEGGHPRGGAVFAQSHCRLCCAQRYELSCESTLHMRCLLCRCGYPCPLCWRDTGCRPRPSLAGSGLCQEAEQRSDCDSVQGQAAVDGVAGWQGRFGHGEPGHWARCAAAQA